MADDTRKGRKASRRKVVKEVKESQKAAAAEKPKRAPKQSPPRGGRKSRAATGADVWLNKIRNTFGAKAARDLWDSIGDPDRTCLQLVNKLLTTYTFAILNAQQMLAKKIGTPGEDGARLYMQDLQQNARSIKDMCNALVKLRAQFVDEDLDSRPDVIELVGAEHLRAQLTTLTDQILN